jgi:biotin carboxylase
VSSALRIWVNRSYSTTLHALAQLRDNPDGVAVTIIGTHADPDSPVLTGCDEIADEPPGGLAGPAYAQWALDFAARHRVDVLWPRFGQQEIAAAQPRFAAAGVAVVAPGADVIERCEDKARCYEIAAAAGLEIPPYRIAHDATELQRALQELGAEVGPAIPLCVKPVGGVGGVGFRVVRDTAPTWEQLLADPEPRVSSTELVRAYDLASAPEPLVIQPWQDDPELSVDLLANHGTVLAAVTRGKPVDGTNGRARWVREDPTVAGAVEALTSALGLHSLANIQFRWWCGRPVLLEVNPRASAGLHQTSLAGINLPWAAVRLARGLPVGPFPAVGSARYATVPDIVALPPTARHLAF